MALVGKRVENGMGENKRTVALVGERVENGMGENRREQLWHWLGRE